MKFSYILSSSVLATFTLAAPSNRLADRIARRESRRAEGVSRLTHPMIPAGSGTKETFVNGVTNETHVEYSGNWAGAVIENPPSGQTWNKVSAQITVPTPSAPSSASGTYAASAWVGIDGDTCQNAILQGGVDFYAVRSGSGTRVSYDAWYEWFPDFAHDFTGISISAGNVIQMSVQATSLTAGSVTLENLSTGQTVTKSLTSSASLCGTNAEWIVEDFQSGNSQVPFANFGTVTFSNAVAGTSSSSQGTSGATILDIRQGSTVYTDVSIPSSNQVSVRYV
ncbi:MAG: hypothetical protein Q9160_007420 [Pyrenula sp. 1 TL-2023]